MKKIEKYIIAVIVLIAIGAIGSAIYFGINKSNNLNNNNKNTLDLDNNSGNVDNEDNNTNDSQENGNEDKNKIDAIDIFSNDIIINDENLISKLQTNDAKIINDANKYLYLRINDKLYHYLNKTYSNLNEMNNQDKLWLAYWITKDDKTNKGIEDYTNNEINNILINLFGNKFSLVYEDMLEDEKVYYSYNQNTNKYESTGAGSGALLYTPIIMECIDYKMINSKYYITYKSAYQLAGDGPDNAIYNAKQEQVLELDWEKDMINEEFYLSDENFNKIYDKLVETTFVFEKYNNKLVLTGYIVE